MMSSEDNKPSKELKDAMEQLAEASPQALLMTQNMPAFSVQGLTVQSYRDPVKAAEASLKLFQAMKSGGNFQSAPLKDKPEVKASAQTHRGFKLHYVRMTWDLEKMAEKTPGGKDMVDAIKKLIGEGIQSWFGTDGNVVVTVTAKDWDTA